MSQNEITMEACRASWRGEACLRANIEAEDHGLVGMAALDFVSERELEIYCELEKLGEENIT